MKEVAFADNQLFKFYKNAHFMAFSPHHFILLCACIRMWTCVCLCVSFFMFIYNQFYLYFLVERYDIVVFARACVRMNIYWMMWLWKLLPNLMHLQDYKNLYCSYHALSLSVCVYVSVCIEYIKFRYCWIVKLVNGKRWVCVRLWEININKICIYSPLTPKSTNIMNEDFTFLWFFFWDLSLWAMVFWLHCAIHFACASHWKCTENDS